MTPRIRIESTDPRADAHKYFNEVSGSLTLSVILEFPYFLEPGDRQVFTTGLHITPPEGYYLVIHSISELAADIGLCVANSGCAYENKLVLKNDSFKKIKLSNDDEVAELILVPIVKFGVDV